MYIYMYARELGQLASGNGLRAAICKGSTWTNADLLFIGPLETTLSKIQMKLLNFSSKKSISSENVVWKIVALL